MITFKELMQNHFINDIPIASQHNMEELLVRINKIRQAYGKPMNVTSCFRTLQEHRDIYRAKRLPSNIIPMQSQHLKGAAVDISDADGKLNMWLKNEGATALEEANLYCEERQGGWQHFQLYPPKSLKRWFAP